MRGLGNVIYEIFRNQIMKDIDQNVRKLGIKIKTLFIEDDCDLKIKVVLIEDTMVDGDLIEVI